MSDFLANLNEEQKTAATHVDGPLLIVAGAGTGKTTVLISRLAYLLLEKKENPDSVLLMTFTDKATGEMMERADKIMPYGYFDLWINTFHSFGERLLREHGLDIGLNPDFKLLSTTEQWILIKKNLDRFNLDYYRPLGNPTKFIHELIHHFSRLKDENISPAEYSRYAETLEPDLVKENPAGSVIKKTKKKEAAEADDDLKAAELEIKKIKEQAAAYEVYTQLLLADNYLDFGDLIVYTLKLLKERPNILQRYQQQFKYIMVDEFQDTNWAQYELIKLLAKNHNNLVVVGDDDQAIYKFRGASLSNIMQFKDDYPKAKEVVLTANYRSRPEILDGAYRFIQNNNPNRLEAKLKIDKKIKAGKKFPATGRALEFLSFKNEAEEASFVGEKIKELLLVGEEPNEMAILVRSNSAAEKFIFALKRLDIPHQFVSLKGLYFKPIILDLLAYFKLLDNYHESPALFRVLSMEIFKVSHADLISINKMASRKVWSLFEALKNISSVPDISVETVLNVNKLLGFIEKHSTLVKTSLPSQVFLRFVYDTGLIADLDYDQDREIFSYLNQFYQKVKTLENTDPNLRLKDLIEALDLELEAGEAGSLSPLNDDFETVKITTVHGAKGLEFKYVFLVDLVDKRFPTINRGEKISLPLGLVREKLPSTGNFHLEEERRLFYVALTRAKEKIYLTAAKDYGGKTEKKPSAFIKELGLDPTLDQEEVVLKSELLTDLAEIDRVKTEKEINYSLPTHFSFSQLAAFSSCPLQYKLAFILKIPAPADKSSLIFGRVMHNTLYRFLLPQVLSNSSENSLGQGALFSSQKETESPASNILEIFKLAWQEDGYKNKEERESYREKGEIIAQRFVKELEAEGWPQVLFLEKRFSFKIGGEVLKGTIDRVDRLKNGNLEVIDYKTGSPKEKLDWDGKRQLILYLLVLEALLKTKVEKLTYYYLENGAKLSFSPKEEEKTKLILEIESQIKKIKECHFPPQPSQLCGFCDFKGICEFREQ